MEATHAAYLQALVWRLRRGDDLEVALNSLVTRAEIRAGCILSCVGSLLSVTVRLPDQSIRTEQGCFEIASLTGTLSRDGVHAHISVADGKGDVFGGHLCRGAIVDTTVELVVGVLADVAFSRVLDGQTGYKELVVDAGE